MYNPAADSTLPSVPKKREFVDEDDVKPDTKKMKIDPETPGKLIEHIAVGNKRQVYNLTLNHDEVMKICLRKFNDYLQSSGLNI